MKRNDNSRKLLVKVYSTEENVMTCSFGVIELTPELKETILSMKAELERVTLALKNKASIYQLNAFNYSCDFIDESNEIYTGEKSTCGDLLEEMYGVFEEANSEIVKIDIEENEYVAVRDDATILYVSDLSFKYSTYVKHTSIRLDTTTIPFDVLEETPLTIEFSDDYIAIMRGKEEVVGWTQQEWEEDPCIVFPIANAIKMAKENPSELLKKLNK